MNRFAFVTGADHRERLAAYLPANYAVLGEGSRDGRTFFVIGGRDAAGWTLDGFVLPRLASGLIFGEEVDEAAARAVVASSSRPDAYIGLPTEEDSPEMCEHGLYLWMCKRCRDAREAEEDDDFLDDDEELSDPVLDAAHERGFENGYRAAIHDARQPGSRAHAELFEDDVESRRCTTITDAWEEYVDRCGAGGPVRTQDELRDEIHAQGFRYEEIGHAFWDALDQDAWFAISGDATARNLEHVTSLPRPDFDMRLDYPERFSDGPY